MQEDVEARFKSGADEVRMIIGPVGEDRNNCVAAANDTEVENQISSCAERSLQQYHHEQEQGSNGDANQGRQESILQFICVGQAGRN